MKSLNPSSCVQEYPLTVGIRFQFNPQLDVHFLDQTYGNNLEFARKMFHTFMLTIDTDLEELESAVNRLDYYSIKSVTHKIKNNFKWIGLQSLSNMVIDIDAAAYEASAEVVVKFEVFKSAYFDKYPLILSELQRISSHLKSEV